MLRIINLFYAPCAYLHSCFITNKSLVTKSLLTDAIVGKSELFFLSLAFICEFYGIYFMKKYLKVDEQTFFLI